jgi:superoxide dismutase, Cu-Zn family
MKNLAMLSVLALLTAASCAHSKASTPMAMATIQPTSGSTVTGTVHFQDLGGGNVQVKVDLTGVPPGVHGFHVHDKGACGDNGMAAGGHFNPMGTNHGAPDATPHHSGDFGNVNADPSGEVHQQFVTQSVTVTAGTTSVVGHAVILHANPDDLVTQPTGNAGGRIACGVVEAIGKGPM